MSGPYECVTDKDGKFLLENVYPGRGTLLIPSGTPIDNDMPEWTAKAIVFENIKPGQTKKNLKLVLVKGGTISGKVTDSSGNPLQNISLRLISDACPDSGPAFKHVKTAEDGTWSYRFPPGKVNIFIETLMKDATWSRIKNSKKMKNLVSLIANYSTSIKSGQEIKDIDFKLDKELPGNSLYR